MKKLKITLKQLMVNDVFYKFHFKNIPYPLFTSLFFFRPLFHSLWFPFKINAATLSPNYNQSSSFISLCSTASYQLESCCCCCCCLGYLLCQCCHDCVTPGISAKLSQTASLSDVSTWFPGINKQLKLSYTSFTAHLYHIRAVCKLVFIMLINTLKKNT